MDDCGNACSGHIVTLLLLDSVIPLGRNSVLLVSRFSCPPNPFTHLVAWRAWLVILKPSHPRGPVFNLDAASLGPRSSRIELPVPLERPEFLHTHVTDGRVHEEHVDRAIVTVDAYGHGPRKGGVQFLPGGRAIERACFDPGTIKEERYIGYPFDVARAPIILCLCYADRWRLYPRVQPVAHGNSIRYGALPHHHPA